jgi:cytochrome c-type biogenesis protein CcmH
MKRRHSLAFLLALIGLVWTVASAGAVEEVYSERTLDIARKLQCPVCAGQSVADSNSGLAAEMRNIIEQKVQAGESEQEILAYFVARYGESILSEPPKSGFTLGLWWAPVVMVVIGALVVASFAYERTRRSGRAVPARDDDEELEAIAREVLGQGGGRMPSG